MKPAKTVFRQYMKKKGLLYSKQREQILNIFLKTEKHVTVDELHTRAKKRNPRIGLATV